MPSVPSLLACSEDDVTLERVLRVVEAGSAESLTLEFKSTIAPKNVAKSVAAMANTYGGIIIVGIDDKPGPERVQGVEIEVLSQTVNVCHALLEPPWVPEIVPVQLESSSDRFILVVRVIPGQAPRPLLLGGSAPVRLHGRKREQPAAASSQPCFTQPGPTSVERRQFVQAAQLPTKPDGSADADFAIRTGLWVPASAGPSSWRPLSERGIDRFVDSINQSPLNRMLMENTGCLAMDWRESIHFTVGVSIEPDMPTSNGKRWTGWVAKTPTR